MPRFNGAHSTQCCGAHSFSGFGNDCDTDPNLINAAMVGAPVGRLGDITLNGDQVRRPRMMQRLADLGFVLDAHWINSVHGSHVYRFTRCDSRRALLDGPIAGNWNGMVMEPNLTGDLPRIVQQQPAGNRANGLVQAVQDRNVAPAAPAAPAPHRHENARMPVLQDAQAPARPANPQVVGRYWHCVFRDGRRGAGYQTYAEANRNLGRRTRIDRFEILSDGNTRWVERVNN